MEESEGLGTGLAGQRVIASYAVLDLAFSAVLVGRGDTDAGGVGAVSWVREEACLADTCAVGQDEQGVALKTCAFHAAFVAIRNCAVAVEADSVFEGEASGASSADTGFVITVGAG